MSITDRKLRVFLCHASQDKHITRELCQRLLAENWIDPWLDEEKLLPGQDWDLEIEKAVQAADAVIVCLSRNSVTKEGYVQKEIRFVLNIADEKPEGAIFLIPLRINDCPVPRRLVRLQHIDYFPKVQRGNAFDRLLVSLDELYRITVWQDVVVPEQRKKNKGLTNLELAMVELLIDGATYQQIAHKLGMSVEPVYYFVGKLYEKTSTKNREELSAWWKQHSSD